MLAYGIAIDASMLTNVLQTDVKEAGDLLNWQLPLTVGALAVPPVAWLVAPTRARGGAAAAHAAQRGAFRRRRAGGRGCGVAGVPGLCLHHAQPHPAALPDQPPQHRLCAGQHCHQTAAHGHAHHPARGARCPTGCQLRRPVQAAAAGAGAGRNRPRGQLWHQRLRTRHHPAAGGPARPHQCWQRLGLRHQHSGLGAVHVFAPGPQWLRGAPRQL